MTQSRCLGVIATAVVVVSASATAHAAPPVGAHRNFAQHRGGWMARDADLKHPWLYVSSEQNAVVQIYDLAKFGIPQIGQITTGLTSPTGMALDANGTLYVSNYYGGNVAIYPAGSTKPSSTLTSGIISLPIRPSGISLARAAI